MFVVVAPMSFQLADRTETPMLLSLLEGCGQNVACGAKAMPRESH